MWIAVWNAVLRHVRISAIFSTSPNAPFPSPRFLSSIKRPRHFHTRTLAFFDGSSGSSTVTVMVFGVLLNSTSSKYALMHVDQKKQSYATQLSSQEIDSLLFVLKQSNAESFVQPLRSARDEGITEEGFLELMKLFLRRDRPESNWVMLRSLGYL